MALGKEEFGGAAVGGVVAPAADAPSGGKTDQAGDYRKQHPHMEIFINSILPSLLSGLLCLWLGHRLGRSARSLDRRRAARAQLRRLAIEVEGTGMSYLPELHRRAVALLAEIRIGPGDELGWLARRRFQRRCGALLAVPASAYRAQTRPDGQQEQARMAAWQQQRTQLRDALNRIAETL